MKNINKYLILNLAISSMLFTQIHTANAQTASFASEALWAGGNAVIRDAALTIKNALIRTGFSGTSAEVAIAMSKASSIVRASASALASPSAVAVAGSFAAGYLIGTGIYQAGSKLISWYQNADGTVVISTPQVVSTLPAIKKGDTVWKTTANVTGGTFYLSQPELFASLYMSKRNASPTNGTYTETTSCSKTASLYTCTFRFKNVNTNNPDTFPSVQLATYPFASAIDCPEKNFVIQSTSNQYSCDNQNVTFPTTGGNVPTTYPNPGAAIPGLTDEDKAQPLNPGAIEVIAGGIAGGINTAPDYVGPVIPPLLATDVPVRTVSDAPTVNDMVKPLPPGPLTTDFPKSITAADPVTGSAASNPSAASTPATNATKVDLGADPGIPQPDIKLEDTPTAKMILDPIFNLLPSFKNLQLSSGGGSCPHFEFSVFSKSFNFDSVCNLLEQHRGTIQAATLAMYGILSIIIVLAA